jgi:hypothetical protein
VQELMRHSNITTTMNLYAQAFSDDAREAQAKIIELVRTAPIPQRSSVLEQPVSLTVQ